MSKNHLGIFSNKFIAGRIKEKNDAAIIIPALLNTAQVFFCYSYHLGNIYFSKNILFFLEKTIYSIYLPNSMNEIDRTIDLYCRQILSAILSCSYNRIDK